MVLKAIQKVNVNGQLLKDLPRVFNTIQEHIIQAVKPLLTDPFLDGVLISDLELAVGDNIIDHGLGRKYQGYLITKQNAVSSFYLSSTTNNSQHLTIILVASAAVTIDLRVF